MLNYSLNSRIMKILKKITYVAILLVITASAFGQKHKGDRKAHKERIQVMKVGYITEKLDLSTTEAQQFWPIYNEFDAKMEEIRRTLRKMRKAESAIDEMTDAAVEKMINDHNNARQKELDILYEYNLKFKTVLPIKKVAKLYKAEHGFKRELLKKLNSKKGEANKPHSPPPPRE